MTQAAETRDEGLKMFTIYHNADDYPGEYVVRLSLVTPGGDLESREICARGQTLAYVREAIGAEELMKVDRDVSDVLSIVETWF